MASPSFTGFAAGNHFWLWTVPLVLIPVLDIQIIFLLEYFGWKVGVQRKLWVFRLHVEFVDGSGPDWSDQSQVIEQDCWKHLCKKIRTFCFEWKWETLTHSSVSNLVLRTMFSSWRRWASLTVNSCYIAGRDQSSVETDLTCHLIQECSSKFWEWVFLKWFIKWQCTLLSRQVELPRWPAAPKSGITSHEGVYVVARIPVLNRSLFIMIMSMSVVVYKRLL